MPSYLFEQLAAFCRAHPIQSKVLFVPTPQVGCDVQTALAARGERWVNLRVCTPAERAERRVGPQLRAKGWTPLTRGADQFFLGELVQDCSVGKAASYFSTQPLTPGMVRTLGRTLHGLRMAGVMPEDLEEASEIEEAKRRPLAEVLAAYEVHLADQRLYDDARLFREAVRATEGRHGDSVYAILDETPLWGWARRFVRSVAGDRLYRIGSSIQPVPPPRSYAAVHVDDAPTLETEVSAPAPGVRLWTDGLTPDDRDTVRLRTAPGAALEVRGLLREVIGSEMPLDQVEVAYTTEQPYLALLYEAARQYDLPATFARGIPVRLTWPGQALQGFYRWIQQGFDTGELVRLCRARLIAFGEGLPPHIVAACLERGGKGRGRARHRTILRRLGQRGEADEEQAPLAQIRDVLDELVACVPEGSATDVTAVARAGLRFLEGFVPATSDPERGAYASLQERIRAIERSVGRERGSLARITQMMAGLIDEHKAGASAVRPGHLHVVPLRRAGYTGRAHQYVLGLDASSFPGTAEEDPILLDREREQVHPELVLRRTRTDEPRWHLARVLGGAPGTVTLCARTQDLAEGRPVYPSALFQQAAMQLGYDSEADESSSVPLFPLVPGIGEQALDDTEALLARRHAAGYAEAVQRAAPWLVEGQHAQGQREQDRLTRFDGWVGRPTPELVLTEDHAVVSASRLETLAACPYRYFLKYVLQVEPPERPDDDPARWLDPLQFGALLHELFHAFMDELGSGEQPGMHHLDQLEDILQEKIDAYREGVPVQHEAAFRADRIRLQRSARVFLQAEAQQEAVDPVGFEVSFGRGEDGPLQRPHPVSVVLSDEVTLRLRGQIDRIDRLPDGNYAIWDYKTGSLSRFDRNDLMNAGQRLQWALYAYAFEALLREREESARVAQTGYFFTSARGLGRRITDVPPSPEKVAATLKPLLELVEQGAFVHAQKDRTACRFCDYRRICAEEVKTKRDCAALCEATDHAAIVDALQQWMEIT